MSVVECDVPRHSALGKDLIERADFRDAYRAPLSRSDLSVVEIFFAIFARRPGWMNLMLIARNKAAALAGLEVPTTAEIINMEKRDHYFVVEKIGPWPIFFLGSDELVAGQDNKHMDFRLSIMKMHNGIRPSIVVSTLCMIHNKCEQYYLSSIIPFHKFGLRRLMASALCRAASLACRLVRAALAPVHSQEDRRGVDFRIGSRTASPTIGGRRRSTPVSGRRSESASG